MKKKCIALLLITTIIISGCGSKNSTIETSEPPVEVDEEPNIEDTASETSAEEDLSELEALGDIEVEKELFDVTLTIPAEYIGETTQEELDAAAEEAGYQITLNEDGSATYVMTKSQHKKLMDDMAASVNQSLDDMLTSGDYPNFTSIETNDDFTEFTVTTKSTELDIAESFSVLGFYMTAGIYHIFSGEEVDNIHVDFINADSGEIIHSADSSETGE